MLIVNAGDQHTNYHIDESIMMGNNQKTYRKHQVPAIDSVTHMLAALLSRDHRTEQKIHCYCFKSTKKC